MMYQNQFRAVKCFFLENCYDGQCDRGATKYGIFVQGAISENKLKTTAIKIISQRQYFVPCMLVLSVPCSSLCQFLCR
jgi:hypothetical protein